MDADFIYVHSDVHNIYKCVHANVHMEKSVLEEFNHWWLRKEVDPDLALSFKRDSYYNVLKHMNDRFIIALVGLRRIGKTTLMYQLIQELISGTVKPTNMLFFSFDETSATLSDVMASYMELHNKDLRTERVYVFLDEIQKRTGWENEIKKYYDLYPKLKFVISGSESLFIKKKTKETLAGRILQFTLEPFSFKEYVRFNGMDDKTKYETAMKPLFVRFISKGGFPETFSLKNDIEFRDYIRALVVDRIIYKDIPKLFNIDDPDFLRTLLELIAVNPGLYVDYQSLSRQFGKDRRVIKSYLSYLQESFLVSILGNYRKGRAATLRKRKRAYPADTAISYLYRQTIDDAFFGRMVETAAINKTKASVFWKNSNEIDMIYKDMPVEVKYQEQISQSDLKPINEFMGKFGKRDGLMITKKDERDEGVENGKIKLIPAWKWLLNL